MRKKLIIMALLTMALLAMSAGCGSNSGLGGGVSEFKTVMATAVAGTTRLEADLITGNTCSDIGSTGGTISTESIDFTITSTALTSPALPIVISGYTVSYVPKNAGVPALTPITSAYGPVTIFPGGTATIGVPVITDVQKRDLIIADLSFPCSLNIYQYDVNVSFNAAELGADDSSKHIGGSTVMAIADRDN